MDKSEKIKLIPPMLSTNDAVIMNDITNICQSPNTENKTKKLIIRRTPKRKPSCDLTMCLRSKPRSKPMTYDNTCNTSKAYANMRYDSQYKRNNPKKRKYFDENDKENNIKPPKKRHKKNNNWGNKVKKSNPSRVVAIQHAQQQKQQQINKNVEILDTKIKELNQSKMNWSDHRLIDRYNVVKLFYVLQKQYNETQYIALKEAAYTLVGAQYNKCEGTIRKFVQEFELNQEIKRSLQGQFGKYLEGLHSVELKMKFKSHVDAKIKSKKHFSAADLLPWVNNDLLKHRVAHRGQYKANTVRYWLINNGYKFGTHQKAVYVDGHERPDVQKYRKEYVGRMIKMRENEFLTVDDNDKTGQEAFKWILERKQRGCITYIRYIHDESVIHIWDKHKRGWFSKTAKPFLPKSEGKGYNISDFICEFDGYLCDGERKARLIHKIGKGPGEYYFTCDKVLEQIDEAIDIHYNKFGCVTARDKKLIVPVFCFDNAGIHTEMPADALTVKHMNINRGGKQAKLKNGWYKKKVRRGRERIVQQKMVDTNDVPKGVRVVLQERGYDTKGIYGDNLKNMLASEPDFVQDSKFTRVVIRVNNLGGIGDYAPKYHSELQLPIEAGWGAAKTEYRNLQDFTIRKTDEIMKRINLCLDNIPLKTIRKWFRKMRRYEDAYYDGATSADILKKVEQIKKQKKQHRIAPKV